MSVLAIAHRAGNTRAGVGTAAALGAHVLEADVHRFRGRLELRHGKALRPLPLLWDEGRLSTRRSPPLQLDWLFDAVPSGASLMLDLKGPGRVGRHVAQALRTYDGPPVLVCSRWWPGVDAVAGLPQARRVLTARTAVELDRLRRRLPRDLVLHGVSLHRDLVRTDVVGHLLEHVEVVMTWPVDDHDTLAQVLQAGVNAVISDHASVLAAVLALGGPTTRSPGAR